jgi:hypothetical protein
MGTVRVSAVKFRSTHLKTLSASPAGGTPAVAAGRRLLLVLPLVVDGACSAKSAGCTGPTSVHNRYIVVRYSGIHKNDIYKKKLKN